MEFAYLEKLIHVFTPAVPMEDVWMDTALLTCALELHALKVITVKMENVLSE